MMYAAVIFGVNVIVGIVMFGYLQGWFTRTRNTRETEKPRYQSVVTSEGIRISTPIETPEEIVRILWEAIIKLAKPHKIILTIPRDPCTHGVISDEPSYQIRCWKDCYGKPQKGHVGEARFGIFDIRRLTTPLSDDENLWKDQLWAIGIEVYDKQGEVWIRETKQADDGSLYDVITLSRH